MGDTTKISWTDATWNPTTGCTEVSPGCDECYARELTKRFPKGFPNGFQFTLHPERLDQPLHWKEPRRIFVNSMSDLFHKDMPDDFLIRVWNVMLHADSHTYQILTKRPWRMRYKLEKLKLPVPDHIWLGTSVETPRFLDRITALAGIPCKIHFLSAEPLLAPMPELIIFAPLLQWVICGGESGPHFRPMKLEWAREVRDICHKLDVPFFFKQGSGRFPGRNNLLDGRLYEEFPTVN